MAANFESGFSANGIELWHGLGEIIKDAPTSEDAIRIAGLDWDVIPKPIYDEFGRELPGYKVNIRSSDNMALGIVTDRYKVVQNREAFAFTDELLGQGVRYETAGSLASGKRVWMLARMENTWLAEEEISPFMVFTNSHDGTGAIRVAMTPVRVCCENTLNLALKTADRHWSCVHKGDIMGKLEEARFTLASAERYMKALEEEFGELKLKKVTEERLRQQKYEDKLKRKKNDIITIYHDKPDLVGTERSAFRFVNAVSDYATHTDDHKQTKNYQENLFMRTIDGNGLIDTAYQLALVA